MNAKNEFDSAEEHLLSLLESSDSELPTDARDLLEDASETVKNAKSSAKRCEEHTANIIENKEREESINTVEEEWEEYEVGDFEIPSRDEFEEAIQN